MTQIFVLIFLTFSSALMAQTPGTLNTAFSENGWDSLSIHNNGLEVNNMLVQPDGKILINSTAYFSDEGHEARLIRYNTDGTIDNTFGGGDGIVKTFVDYGENFRTRAADMATQSDGKILIIGDVFYFTERVIRLQNDGSLDPTYGNLGMVEFPSENSLYFYQCAIQSDDKLIVAGKKSISVDEQWVDAFFLWRLTTDGERDMSFGDGGEVVITHPEGLAFSGQAVCNEISIMPNDDIVVNITSPFATDLNLLFFKYTPAGQPALDWAENGIRVLEFGPQVFTYTYSSHTILGDGSISFTFPVPGEIDLTTQNKIFKLNPDGSFDDTFDAPTVGGVVDYSVILPITSSGNDIYCVYYYEFSEFASIYAFNSNGEPIQSFGNDGIAEIDQNGMFPGTIQWAAGIADGHLYFSHVSSPYEDGNIAVLTVADVIISQGAVSMGGANNSTYDRLIFPNPAQEVIAMKNQTGMVFNIFNLTGQLMKTISLKSPENLRIDISDLPNGSYFITDEKNQKSDKFIVLR